MTKAEEIKAQMATLEEELKRVESEKVVPLRPEVVDTESVEVVEDVQVDPATDGEQVSSMIYIGYTSKGRPIFDVQGEANLLTLEGMLVYAKRMLDKEWELREEQAAAEAAKARAAAKTAGDE